MNTCDYVFAFVTATSIATGLFAAILGMYLKQATKLRVYALATGTTTALIPAELISHYIEMEANIFGITVSSFWYAFPLSLATCAGIYAVLTHVAYVIRKKAESPETRMERMR